MKDLRSKIITQEAAAPAVAKATIAGTTIDLQGFGSLCILSVIGAGAYDATKYVTPTLTESDDDSSYTAVASTHYTGDLSAVADTLAANDQRVIGYVGHKRYVKFSYVVTGVLAADVLLGAWAIKGDPQYAPTV